MSPLHIQTSPPSELSTGLLTAALPAQRGQCGSVARRHMATAPAQRLPIQSDSLLSTDAVHSGRLKPSTAPLPKIKPISPRDTPRMPSPRRWRRRPSVSSGSGHVQCPTDSSANGVVRRGSFDLDHMCAEEFYSPRLSSRESHGHRLSSRGHLDSADLDLTIAPTSTEARPAPGRTLADDSLFLQRSMDTTSWDGADVTPMNSIEVAGDPLAALYSKADLSTMADETSIWDHMWSVFGGSGPSESEEMLDQSGGHIPFTMSWPKIKARPAHKRCEWQGDSKGPGSKGLPGAHQALKGAGKSTSKALEAVAKRSLFESTPLHVHGIDRFLRASTAHSAKRS